MLEDYGWVEEVVIDAPASTDHVDWLQIAGVLHRAWFRYLTEGIGLSEHEIFDEGSSRPIVREVRVRLNAPVRSGDRFSCGVRTLKRSRSTLVLEQVLVSPDGTNAAAGEVVLVTIDAAGRRSVEVPERLWTALLTAEGRTIPDDRKVK